MKLNPLFRKKRPRPSGTAAYALRKQKYVEERIIYFSVLAGAEMDALFFYQDGHVTELAPEVPAVLHLLRAEVEPLGYSERFWTVRRLVAEMQRKNPDCGVEFLYDTQANIDACQKLANGELGEFL